MKFTKDIHRWVKKSNLNGMEIILLFLTTVAFTFFQFLHENFKFGKRDAKHNNNHFKNRIMWLGLWEKNIQGQLKIHMALLQFSIRCVLIRQIGLNNEVPVWKAKLAVSH